MRKFISILFTTSFTFVIACKGQVSNNLHSIHGLWVEQKYMECLLSQKSTNLCAHNENFDIISIYIPTQNEFSNVFKFDVFGLHTHDFIQLSNDSTSITNYYTSQIPENIPSQKLNTSEIIYFSDSLHKSYMQFKVIDNDTILELTRDSIDKEWGGRHVVYKKYKGDFINSIARTSGVHLLLNSIIYGKYRILNPRGKTLNKWLELSLDGTVISNIKEFQNKRFQIGTEFYCMPYPDLSYILFIDLFESKQYIKITKEWITTNATDEYCYEYKNGKFYIYKLKLNFMEYTKKLIYILEPIK